MSVMSVEPLNSTHGADTISDPAPAVGVLVYNPQGDLLMIRSRKWAGKWSVPGGRIERGEKAIDTLRREVFEETGLEIQEAQLVMVQDCIDSREFYRPAHFVILMYLAHVIQADSVKLNGEGEEYRWMSAEDALLLDLNTPTRKLIMHRLQKERGLYGQILVDELSVSACIGVSDEERKSPQTLTCTLKCHVDCIEDAAAADDLSSTVDYDQLAACMRRVAAAKPRKLVETLAEEMIDALMAEFAIHFAELEVRKYPLPDAHYVAIVVRKARLPLDQYGY